MLLFGLRFCAVKHFDQVCLADLRNGKHADSFFHTLEQSLRLIREHDARRYARITDHIRWVLNQVTGSGYTSEYNERIGACTIQFIPMPEADQNRVAAAYACLLVHGATHGLVVSRGIEYTPQNLARIEHLCTAEQSRFVARLDPACAPIHGLQADPTNRERVRTAGGFSRGRSYLARCRSDSKAGAAPNGGPATPSGNSAVREGPPSVS